MVIGERRRNEVFDDEIHKHDTNTQSVSQSVCEAKREQSVENREATGTGELIQPF